MIPKVLIPNIKLILKCRGYEFDSTLLARKLKKKYCPSLVNKIIHNKYPIDSQIPANKKLELKVSPNLLYIKNKKKHADDQLIRVNIGKLSLKKFFIDIKMLLA